MKALIYKYIALLLIVLPNAFGCASKLDPVKNRKTPVAKETQTVSDNNDVIQSLDLSTISFVNLDDGKTVNLGDYFTANKIDNMLLFFGSQNCDACNEKNRDLRDSFYQKTNVSFVGVNTDPSVARPRVNNYLKKNSFDFIKWSDPQGKQMISHFLGQGTFGVPLTVFINSKGIVWRYVNKDKVALPDIIARADTMAMQKPTAELLQELPKPALTPRSHSIVTKRKKAERPLLSALSRVGKMPGIKRFRNLFVKSFRGEARSLDSFSGPSQIIQISEGSCDSICEINKAKLIEHCSQVGCSVVNLISQPDSSTFLQEDDYVGGQELLAAYSSLFNWDEVVQFNKNEFRVWIDQPKGPFVLAFNQDQELTGYAKGDLTNLSGLDKVLLPTFPLFSRESGKTSLGSLLPKASFTVLAVFDKMCGSCMEEIKSWNQVGGLYNDIKAKGGQMILVEVGLPQPEQSQEAYYQSVVKGEGSAIATLNNQIPVFTDPSPMDEDFIGHKRLFQGYLTALNPEWEGLYGTVIYDSEGKIIGSFKAESNGEHKLLDAVQNL